MVSEPLYMRKGDLRPPVQGSLKWENGTAVDLTGCSVTFTMIDENGTKKVNAVSASIVGSPTDGKVKYEWSGTDTDTAGAYSAYFTVTFADAKTQKFPSKGEYMIYIGD